MSAVVEAILAALATANAHDTAAGVARLRAQRLIDALTDGERAELDAECARRMAAGSDGR